MNSVSLSTPTPGLPPSPAEPLGLLQPRYRAASIGMLALITIFAFEHFAVTTAMPVVAAALDGMAWYALAFGAALASGVVGMVVAGRWADRAGPLAPMWAGWAIFVGGLVVVGLAPAMGWLVLGRTVQGFGGALMSVALYALVGRAFPSAMHPRIFAAFAAAWVLPVIVGPGVVGWIVDGLGWRWVFLAAVALAVPAALLLKIGLGRVEMRTPEPAPGPPAPFGAALGWAGGAAAGAALLYLGGAHGPQGAAMIAAALVLLALCAPRLLPPGTLAGRAGLPAVIGLRGLAAAAFFTGEVFLPLLLVEQRGFSTAGAGAVLTVGALGWSFGSWLQGRSRHGRDAAARVRRLRIGMALIALGLVGALPALSDGVNAWLVVLPWTLGGTGIGLVYPTLSVLTLEYSAPAEQGANSGALQLSDSLVSAVGLALAGALFAAAGAARPGHAAALGFATLLALAGLALAGRCRPA